MLTLTLINILTPTKNAKGLGFNPNLISILTLSVKP